MSEAQVAKLRGISSGSAAMDATLVDKELLRFDPDQAKVILEQKLDPRWIKQRDAGFGKKLDYIEGARVIEILNDAFNYQWSFEILDSEIIQAEPYLDRKTSKEIPQSKYAQVLGQLTVPGFGMKQAYGSKSIVGKTSEQESIFKAAMTDALKKCATLFGVAKELYLDDVEDAPAEQGTNWNNAKPINNPPAEDPWQRVGAEVKRLRELKASLGIADNDQLVPYIEKWSNNTLHKADDITPDNIKSFTDFLKNL